MSVLKKTWLTIVQVLGKDVSGNQSILLIYVKIIYIYIYIYIKEKYLKFIVKSKSIGVDLILKPFLTCVNINSS